MSQKIFRFVLLGLAAGLMLGAITGCFFGGGGEDEEPTPDLQATIDAAVRDDTPTETPTPEPTDTPEPPTPDVAATVAAMLEANRPTAAPPTNTPEPTDTPVPTNTPVPPTNTPPPPPTNTPQPTAESPQSGPPCIIVGVVTRGGVALPEDTTVTARTNGVEVERTVTNANGGYQLTITRFGERFDLWVSGRDSGVNTDVCARGARQLKHLPVN